MGPGLRSLCQQYRIRPQTVLRLHYLRHFSTWLDLVILLRTIKTVLEGRRAMTFQRALVMGGAKFIGGELYLDYLDYCSAVRQRAGFSGGADWSGPQRSSC